MNLITSTQAHVSTNGYVAPNAIVNGTSYVGNGAKVFGSITDTTVDGDALVGINAVISQSSLIGDIYVDHVYITQSILGDGCDIDVVDAQARHIGLQTHIEGCVLQTFTSSTGIHLQYIHLWGYIP